jgi:hypothetical protein
MKGRARNDKNANKIREYLNGFNKKESYTRNFIHNLEIIADKFEPSMVGIALDFMRGSNEVKKPVTGKLNP